MRVGDVSGVQTCGLLIVPCVALVTLAIDRVPPSGSRSLARTSISAAVFWVVVALSAVAKIGRAAGRGRGDDSGAAGALDRKAGREEGKRVGARRPGGGAY